MGRKVLIVEDDPGIAEALTKILEMEGHEARWCDAVAALGVAIEQQPHVILLDYLMPVRDGAAVATELARNKTTAHIPIVLMTAIAGAREAALQIGAADVLIKPFTIDRLLCVLSAHNGGATYAG